MARRWRLDVAYDGTEFAGWARQPGLRTVQGTLEAALATVLRVSAVTVVVAGRTDAGVHARGQVCHLDLPDDAGLLDTSGTAGEALVRRLARLLPGDLRVSAVSAVSAEFDARFSALWRRYVYRICDDPAVADPLRRRETLSWQRVLDVDAMSAGGALLAGTHDFAAFCRRREGATTVRALHELTWTRSGPGVEATVVADAFCHQMVRSLVGASIVVGEGRRPPAWLGDLLGAGVRDPAVPVVPAHGLTLEEVGYPPDDQLAARSARTRARRSPDPSPDPSPPSNRRI